MADKHPYVSGPGNLVQVINHFRSSFPTSVTADTLRKLGFAPKNESYVLNVLRFLGLIDEEGKRTQEAATIFSQHDDASFQKHFAPVVKNAYSALFELHAEKAWALDQNALITFFRSTDQTTIIVGRRQAATFQLLAAFSGHGEVPQPKALSKPAKAGTGAQKKKKAPSTSVAPTPKVPSTLSIDHPPNVGLTVRIEINLPPDGDQETYDRIFRSIRENLLND